MLEGLPLVHSEDYDAPLPEGHRFPMSKFLLLRELLEAEGVAKAEQFVRPEPALREDLELVHEPGYLDAFIEGRLGAAAVRKIGLPWTERLVHRTITAVGGTIRTVELALEHGLACNTAGGTHHAFPGHGSGFCILNDLAVAARVALERGWVERVLIVDLDVHQGDGTAFALCGEPRAFTLSVHCAANFPLRKQVSDLDVEVEPGLEDGGYLAVVDRVVPEVLERVRPELVLYDAGVDVHRDDRLGKLELSDEGVRERDRRVISWCREAGIPTACVIGGGYDRDHRLLARRHSLLHRAASEVWAAERVSG
ncbi:histone deacetylase family protein [Mucisphaera sp.]|uniref:histone deacetylase family protein n=1 Tax=Mucisphaera sp. TaxID=2913024 RepID=UPI003D0E36E4